MAVVKHNDSQLPQKRHSLKKKKKKKKIKNIY